MEPGDCRAISAVLSPGELAKVGLLDPVFCEAFTAKLRRMAPETISPRENHAFIFLLSIMLLHRQFVGGEDRPAERGLALQKVIAG